MVAGIPMSKRNGDIVGGKDPKREKNKGSASTLGVGRWSRGQALGTWRYLGLDDVWEFFSLNIFTTEYYSIEVLSFV